MLILENIIEILQVHYLKLLDKPYFVAILLGFTHCKSHYFIANSLMIHEVPKLIAQILKSNSYKIKSINSNNLILAHY